MSISRGGDYRSSKPIRSFPEPEKKTAWTDKDKAATEFVPKDVPIVLVDGELEKKKRAKKAIRDSMAPPGGLKISPLLEAKRLKYGIPDGVFRARAVFDRIFVYPIAAYDVPDGEEEKYAGTSIHMPNTAVKLDIQEGYRGILISAGLTAMDRLMSHGIWIGDTVMTNKNVPFARRCQSIAEVGDIYVLVMRDADLAGSEDALLREESGETRIEDCGEGGYCHQIVGKKKESVYLRDTW